MRRTRDWWVDRPPLGRAKLWGIIGVVLIALIAVIALFAIPIPHGFAGSVSTAFCSTCGAPPYYFGYVVRAFPTESYVRLSWQSPSGSPVNFSVAWGVLYVSIVGDPQQSPAVCYSSGVSGSCSFWASAGTYTISVEDGGSSEGVVYVTFSGSYALPYA